ncbi:helix-turn-helix domain-containing protein [Gemmata obscuriglobus]|uniref:XRE family transcriptional regulator n=1 Tax=Gemmata obscuriglobus TaxID=114 RepID=A0A2Z3H338_9BACT|nr:XRE family transcriptional regulator [Gemmata obscuriglobus]
MWGVQAHYPHFGGVFVQDQFAKRLRELREARNLSQTELASLANLTLRSIENWEQGRNEPKWSAIVQLATALGVSTEEFRVREPDQQA